MFFPFSCLEVENEKMIWFESGKSEQMGAGSLFSDCSDQSQLLRLNKSLPFPLPLSLCLPMSLSLCLHLCLNSCLSLTLPLNLKLSFCLCLFLSFSFPGEVSDWMRFCLCLCLCVSIWQGEVFPSSLLWLSRPWSDRGPRGKNPKIDPQIGRASEQAHGDKWWKRQDSGAQVNPAEELQQIQTQKIKQIHA